MTKREFYDSLPDGWADAFEQIRYSDRHLEIIDMHAAAESVGALVYDPESKTYVASATIWKIYEFWKNIKNGFIKTDPEPCLAIDPDEKEQRRHAKEVIGSHLLMLCSYPDEISSILRSTDDEIRAWVDSVVMRK